MKRIAAVAVVLGLLMAPEASARKRSTSPYPASTHILGVSWDFANIVRQAKGSDLWPCTWASDGNVYTGWGDGGGFGGDNNNGRTSMGFARITGSPPAVTGKNVWGAAPTYAENLATFAGKPHSMISVGGTLYCWFSSYYNDRAGNPALGGPNPNPAEERLAWSTDLGKTWTKSTWKVVQNPGQTMPGSFLNFGKDNAGARDQYVYLYGYVVGKNGHTLSRILPADLQSDPGVAGKYQYWTGLDGSGNPTWTTAASAAKFVFVDPNLRGISKVVWNAPLQRYIATEQGDQVQQLGIFDAPQPWGPWTTVAYYDTWGNYGTGEALVVDLPTKWISADGKTMWAAFSSVDTANLPGDSFNLLKMTLSTPATGGTAPKITNPASGTVLLPGQTVTATGTGTSLTWAVDRINDGLPNIAQGAGSSITFTVPADSTTAQHIHLTLTGTGGSDARDYPIGTASTPTLAAYWKFDEGTGVVAADSSGHGDAGTLLNGPTWATGKFGKALNFPAGRSIVNVGAKSSLANLHRTGFTVTAWVNVRSGGSSARIVDKDDNSIGWFFKMASATTVQFVSDNGGPMRTSSGSIPANTWVHVAASWTGSTAASGAHVYVNGNLADGAGVDGAGSSGDDSGTPLSIGNRTTAMDRGFDGAIDDLRIYPRVLTAAEIKSLATATAP